MIELNIDNFEEEVLKSEIPVVIDCWAEWCHPCKMMEPVFEELSKEYAGRLKFCKLNTEENFLIAQQYDIQSIPTLLFFKNGKLTGRFVGFAPKPHLKKIIDNNL